MNYYDELKTLIYFCINQNVLLMITIKIVRLKQLLFKYNIARKKRKEYHLIFNFYVDATTWHSFILLLFLLLLFLLFILFMYIQIILQYIYILTL